MNPSVGSANTDRIPVGPVVRIAPNELSFASIDALREIHATPNVGEGFTKLGSLESVTENATFTAPTILWANNAQHKRLKNAVRTLFNKSSVQEQEPILQRQIRGMVVELDRSAELGDAIDIDAHITQTLWYTVSDWIYGEPLSDCLLGACTFPTDCFSLVSQNPSETEKDAISNLSLGGGCRARKSLLRIVCSIPIREAAGKGRAEASRGLYSI